MKIIIYATHSFGTFETLKEHPDVVVLGFGTKWKGFVEKAKVIQAYLDTLPDDEIVAIIDGFDSYIKKTDGVRAEFESMDCKVLLALDDVFFTKLPTMVSSYFKNKVYTRCKKNYIANAGLMMGYVEYLKIVFHDMANGPSNDDQRNLNLACKKMPFFKIDVNHKILENCLNMDGVKQSNAFFCQIPGAVSLPRITRALFEYAEYFIPEIIIIFLFIYFAYRKRKYLRKLITNARKKLNG